MQYIATSDAGRSLLGLSHQREVRTMTSDFDRAVFDELWLTG